MNQEKFMKKILAAGITNDKRKKQGIADWQKFCYL